MNSVLAVLFVIVATVIGKWLLFDNDDPNTDFEPLQAADPPPPPSQLSKSA